MYICNTKFDRFGNAKHLSRKDKNDENLPTYPAFLKLFCQTSPVCNTRSENTVGKGKKMPVTSNFSFSNSVFYFLENVLPFSSNLNLSSANSLDEYKLSAGKGLSLKNVGRARNCW